MRDWAKRQGEERVGHPLVPTSHARAPPTFQEFVVVVTQVDGWRLHHHHNPSSTRRPAGWSPAVVHRDAGPRAPRGTQRHSVRL